MTTACSFVGAAFDRLSLRYGLDHLAYAVGAVAAIRWLVAWL
jgi:hypothetical protein